MTLGAIDSLDLAYEILKISTRHHPDRDTASVYERGVHGDLHPAVRAAGAGVCRDLEAAVAGVGEELVAVFTW
jgi:hypothetical protein